MCEPAVGHLIERQIRQRIHQDPVRVLGSLYLNHALPSNVQAAQTALQLLYARREECDLSLLTSRAWLKLYRVQAFTLLTIRQSRVLTGRWLQKAPMDPLPVIRAFFPNKLPVAWLEPVWERLGSEQQRLDCLTRLNPKKRASISFLREMGAAYVAVHHRVKVRLKYGEEESILQGSLMAHSEALRRAIVGGQFRESRERCWHFRTLSSAAWRLLAALLSGSEKLPHVEEEVIEETRRFCRMWQMDAPLAALEELGTSGE